LAHEFGNLTWMQHGTTHSFVVLRASHLPTNFGEGSSGVRHHTRTSTLGTGPPFVVFCFSYTWGTHKFEKSKGKSSAAYENDKSGAPGWLSR
uniref:Uncharacterized protein n=1 Tax=Neovison vison TaxID=452646 RepID=A0A8C7B0F4_NEOVI